MKILLVEDDTAIASGLEYSLQQENYQTIVCDSAETANEVVKEQLHSIDLFLLDLSLPDGSGYDICEQIKQRSDKPVIFLTAYDDEVNVVMGLDMGLMTILLSLFACENCYLVSNPSYAGIKNSRQKRMQRCFT